MRSLTVKLVLAFALVSLVGIALVVVMTARFTGNQFREFFENQNRESLIAELEDYYQQNGTWQGIERLANEVIFNQRYNWGYVILDTRDRVILHSPLAVRLPNLPWRVLRSEDGVPLIVDGKVVGTYFSLETRFDLRPPLPTQLTRFYNTLVIASIGAVLVSVFLGILLARSLTRTLRELTVATQKVAKGDLEQQVPIRSNDELGELAVSFNQMSADLAQSRDLRRQMTADIAHELRTPLTVILGHTEALSEGELPPDEETFAIIHDETKRLNRLVEDLRTLSLSDAGELHLNWNKVSPRDLLEHSAAAKKNEAKSKNIGMRIETVETLPLVNVDPDRMTQVLVNIIDNSLRYTPEGGMIRMSAQELRGKISLEIEDTGPGIPAEEIDHLFERFYRGDKSRQREAGGSGLGLAIAKSLVESQNGQITVESLPGQGAKFVITLPVDGD
ncbi:MAG: HAMP domain-containing protein [Chloroflexota bacterium]|nr:MAG: HAMP domain-containing protein [Chloroflexota bacterium]